MYWVAEDSEKSGFQIEVPNTGWIRRWVADYQMRFSKERRRLNFVSLSSISLALQVIVSTKYVEPYDTEIVSDLIVPPLKIHPNLLLPMKG